MTTPLANAELGTKLERLESAIQAVCQYNGGYNSSDVQEAFYDVVNELQDLGLDTAPPPVKRAVTLVVNGREWVLPEPLKDVPKVNSAYWADAVAGVLKHTWRRDSIDKLYFAAQRVHASESDAQAWAEFNKWCRGGGV